MKEGTISEMTLWISLLDGLFWRKTIKDTVESCVCTKEVLGLVCQVYLMDCGQKLNVTPL
jgi:hypothetical protein